MFLKGFKGVLDVVGRISLTKWLRLAAILLTSFVTAKKRLCDENSKDMITYRFEHVGFLFKKNNIYKKTSNDNSNEYIYNVYNII